MHPQALHGSCQALRDALPRGCSSPATAPPGGHMTSPDASGRLASSPAWPAAFWPHGPAPRCPHPVCAPAGRRQAPHHGWAVLLRAVGQCSSGLSQQLSSLQRCRPAGLGSAGQGCCSRWAPEMHTLQGNLAAARRMLGNFLAAEPRFTDSTGGLARHSSSSHRQRRSRGCAAAASLRAS